MKKAALYLRVSTQTQEENYSIPVQKEKLLSYCNIQDWLPAEIFIDSPYSGSNLNRPAIKKLIADVKKFDVVVVYRLDRLSRSQKDTLYLIEDVFNKNEVAFVSISENFDTSTSFGKAAIGFLSIFAQFERESIKERLLFGRKARAKEGLFHGGGFSPIGYDYIDGKLVINEYEAIQVKKVAELYLKGKGIGQICKYMNSQGYKHKNGTWSHPSSIVSVLDTPLYTGHIIYNKEKFEGQHTPILTKEEFEQIQSRRKEQAEHCGRKVFTCTSLLGNFIFCENCGARYFVRQITKKYKYYGCYSRVKCKAHMIRDMSCKARYWSIPELDALVEEEIFKFSIDKKRLRSLFAPPNSKTSNREKKAIEKQVNSIDKQIKKLMDLYQFGSIPAEEISSRIENLVQEQSLLKKSIQEEQEFNYSPEFIDKFIEKVVNIKRVWSNFSLEEKRSLIRSIIDKIYVSETGIRIVWKFSL